MTSMPEIFEPALKLHIRPIEKSDFEEIKRIYESFYKKEFVFPDFVTNFLAAVVIELDGKIVSVAGIRTLVEVINMTDKNQSVRVRREALLQQQHILSVIGNTKGYNSLHAFVQDDIWKHQLCRYGFRPTKGQCLVMEL